MIIKKIAVTFIVAVGVLGAPSAVLAEGTGDITCTRNCGTVPTTPPTTAPAPTTTAPAPTTTVPATTPTTAPAPSTTVPAAGPEQQPTGPEQQPRPVSTTPSSPAGPENQTDLPQQQPQAQPQAQPQQQNQTQTGSQTVAGPEQAPRANTATNAQTATTLADGVTSVPPRVTATSDVLAPATSAATTATGVGQPGTTMGVAPRNVTSSTNWMMWMLSASVFGFIALVAVKLRAARDEMGMMGYEIPEDLLIVAADKAEEAEATV